MNIVEFVRAVRAMRLMQKAYLQKAYFRNRLPADLIEAKRWESVVDKALADGAIGVPTLEEQEHMDNVIHARQLRLAVTKNIYKQEFITEDEAKELLAAPLTPGDSSSFYDDSALLHDPKALEKIARQQVQGAGHEQ